MRVSFALFALLSLSTAVSAGPPERQSRPDISTGGDVLTSTGSSLQFKASAALDTFYLYGGPGSIEGKFATGFPELFPDDQGWTGVDGTELAPRWHRAQYNAANLNSHGVGNHAFWCGAEAGDEPGWQTAPGYGNSWNERLEFRVAVSDPTQGQTVDLDFYFNHDSEPGYDYFNVEYDSSGATILVYSVDGSNQNGSGAFLAPGLRYAQQPTATPIAYSGNDYANNNQEIVIRMTGTTDGAWSDQDGLWPTVAGLAQVDDILVQHADGSSFEDFEGAGPYAWNSALAPYAGYFGRVFTGITDRDPCAENRTPVYGFMDDGLGPYNSAYTGTGTGGTTSVNWSYALPGGWVVNYTGGLSNGTLDLENHIQSPEIDWDLPGAADDGPNVQGVELRFSVFNHLPLGNGIFFQWGVRARSADSPWTPWQNRNFVYYGGWDREGIWENWTRDVSDLARHPSGDPNQKIQVRFSMLDLAWTFAFAGTDGTPSPLFDNLTVVKYELPGPVFTGRTMDFFQDSFAQSGQTDFSTRVARDAADVALDMARDVSTGGQNIAGDSLIVDVTPLIFGTSLDAGDVRLRWVLHTNPLFEDEIRGNLTSSGANESPGAGIGGWDTWAGVTVGAQSTTSAGAPVARRYFFSPPDTDFLYPGDFFEWYVEATDSHGNLSTFPTVLAGFGDADRTNYDSMFTVRALPTVVSLGAHPEILVLDYGGHGPYVSTRRNAFDQNGLAEGVDYDTYVVNAPSSFIDNGIGTAGIHGASLAQLGAYSCVIVDGDTEWGLLRSDSNSGRRDKSEDYELIEAWMAQPADRLLATFADQVGYHSSSNGWGNAEGDNFLANVLGIQFLQQDVAPLLGDVVNPAVSPTGQVPGYATSFIAGSACFREGIRSIPRVLNAIAPINGVSVRGHTFTGSNGTEAASVIWDRMDGGFRKISATFPIGLDAIWTPAAKAAPGASARAIVLEETLGLIGGHGPSGPVTDGGPALLPFRVGVAYPNPFNPKTQVRLRAPREGHVTVHVYNVRGERVVTLLDGEVGAGETILEWNGRDASGVLVASGMYLLNVTGFGKTDRQKLVLLK